MAVAAALGWVIGAPVGSWLSRTPADPGSDSESGELDEVGSSYIPPLYLMASGADADIEQTIRLAHDHGIRRFHVPVPLFWADDVALNFEKVFGSLASESEDASLLLSVSLNPPASWFLNNADAAAVVDGKAEESPSAASEVWLAAAESELQKLFAAIQSTPIQQRVEGIVLGALENNQWYRRNGYETSAANTAGFRDWLEARYQDDALLQAAWADSAVSFENAAIPKPPDNANTSRVFFDPQKDRRNVDYLQYLSESIAGAVNRVAESAKRFAPEGCAVYAKYGYTVEAAANDLGHLALAKVLDGPIDGIVSPVSYKTRNPEGAGILTGPAASAILRGKRWIVFDDTVAGGAESASAQEIDMLRAVQKRNNALALANGFGYIWSSRGLTDGDTWATYGLMRDAYATVWEPKPENSQATAVTYLASGERTVLNVVVDEGSRTYQQCDAKLNNLLLSEVAESVMRSGVAAEFVLLRDVLGGKAKPASVYLFCNAFRLDADERISLHALLQRENAWAIWLYAPGFISDTAASEENVSATVRMNVKAFAEPSQGGSVCKLEGGRWMSAGFEFGDDDRWQPLFYIEDPDADLLASYRANEKASVAVKFFDEGRGSVFVADPALPPDLLREILSIFGQNLLLRSSVGPVADVVCVGPNLMTLYSDTPGERVVDFGTYFNVRDLLEPTVGWAGRQFLTINMREYATRMLYVTPIPEDEMPPIPEEAPPNE
ncbi:MAG: hypothetical protein AMXMBFR84_33680 [Candidatus Hydrogenedentota bacterium]